MKNYLGLRILLGILILFCVYQFSLFLTAHSIEKKVRMTAIKANSHLSQVEQSTAQLKWINTAYAELSDQIVYRIPYLVELTFQELKERQLKLGLDLQGGFKVAIALDQEDIRNRPLSILDLDALKQIQFLIKQRLNDLNFAQAQIQIDEDRGLIWLEVPGQVNAERIRQLVTATTSLGFWNTYQITDPSIQNAFYQADAYLKGKR